MADEQNVSISPKLIQAFKDATRNVLVTMVGTQVTIDEPMEEHRGNAYDVSGIIGFTGEVVGSAVVSLHKDTALKMTEALCCEETEFGSDEFVDAVGELTNMIAGNAKKDFGVNAKIGIPSVVIGPGHTASRTSEIPSVYIPCQSEMGDFVIEVNIKTVGAIVQEETNHEVSACG